jgi:hypothetical protein
MGSGDAYKDVCPFARACPPGIVAPCQARAAGGQVREAAAEEQDAACHTQDVQHGESRGRCFGCDFLDRRGGLVFGGRGTPVACFHGGGTGLCRGEEFVVLKATDGCGMRSCN